MLVPPSDSLMILLAAVSLFMLLLRMDSSSRSLFSFSRSVYKQDVSVIENLPDFFHIWMFVYIEDYSKHKGQAGPCSRAGLFERRFTVTQDLMFCVV